MIILKAEFPDAFFNIFYSTEIIEWKYHQQDSHCFSYVANYLERIHFDALAKSILNGEK